MYASYRTKMEYAQIVPTLTNSRKQMRYVTQHSYNSIIKYN